MSGASSSNIPGDDVATIAPKSGETVAMSLAVEEVMVTRRVRRTLVRASRTTSLRDQAVEADLNHEQVVVGSMAIGRIVDAGPPIRRDSDVTSRAGHMAFGNLLIDAVAAGGGGAS